MYTYETVEQTNANNLYRASSAILPYNYHVKLILD